MLLCCVAVVLCCCCCLCLLSLLLLLCSCCLCCGCGFGLRHPPSVGPPKISLCCCSLSRHRSPLAPPDRAVVVRTRQPENSKRAHFRAPALQTPPKFHKLTPRETQKERNVVGKGKEKREIVGPATLRCPTLRCPTCCWFGPPTLRTPTLRCPTLRCWFGQNRLNKVGQSWNWPKLANLDGQSWIGQSCSLLTDC